ncbi:hypothetical protein ABEB36_002150 [Hypothenemus hampei]|uniref:D-isomer specific 2-hydroxyacid dehydrogenase NAD-binding domain-containing protein n=1 Tax=Hypothenemus hampei TaxID=57062 RepID=A0ABD1F529_HYPHA
MFNRVHVISRHSHDLINNLKKLLPSVQFTEVHLSDVFNLETAEIILADYDQIGPFIYKLPTVKWIQGTWAGLDKLWPYIRKDDVPKFPITRTTGDNFGQLMGEYVIGNIIFWERNYFKVKENQIKKIWDCTVCPHDHRSLRDLTIGILGIGAIGSAIGRALKTLGATVYGFGRRATVSLESPDLKHFSKYYTKDNVKELLSSVDYIVNVLPRTEETNNFLGNKLLEICKGKNVTFINIGRGNIIKETELIDALTNQWISGAILDVFESEPLPATSQLWNFPNVFITPHISGNSRTQDTAENFKINFQRFQRNEPLLQQIDFVKGY